MDDAPAPDAARTPPTSPDAGPTRPPTHIPPHGQQAAPGNGEASDSPGEFNPFPFGAPTADSPVAAAFPELYPPAAPVADSYPPPGTAPYSQPSASPWAQPGSQDPTFQQPTFQQQTPTQPGPQQPTSLQPPMPQPGPLQPPYSLSQQVPGYGPQGPGNPPGNPAGNPPGYLPGYPAGYPTGYPAGYPAGHSPSPQGTNGKAIAGLVLGIVSLGFFFFTLLDIPLIVLGIVFSVLGLRGARRGEGRRGMALAGLICSLVAAVVVTVALTYFVSRGHTCEQRYDRGSSEYNSCLLHLN